MRFAKNWLILGFIILLIVACGGGDDEENQDVVTPVPPSPSVEPTPAGPINPTLPPNTDIETTFAERSSIRVVHAMIGVEEIDIQAGDEYVLRSLDPSSASRMVNVDVGEITIRAYEQRSGAIILEQSIAVEADEEILLVINGTPQAADLLLFDPNRDPIEPGKTRLAFVHAANEVGPLRVLEGDTVLVEGLNAGDISPVVDMQAQMHLLDIFEDRVLRHTVNQIFETGRSYTLVILNDRVAIVEYPTPPQTKIRLIQASPDAPPLRVLLNDNSVVDNLNFTDVTDFQQFAADDYVLHIVDVETGQQLKEFSLILRDNVHTEIIIFGRDNDLEIGTISIDTSRMLPELARLTVFNAVIGVTRIEVTGVGEIDYGLAARYGRSASTEIEQQQIQLVFQSAEDIVELPDAPINLEEGHAYTYVVTGRSETTPIVTSLEVGVEPSIDAEGDFVNPVRIQVINFWSEPIRLYLDDQRVAIGVPPGGISPSASILPASYDLTVLNDSDELLYESEFSLDESYRLYTFVAFAGPDGLVVSGDTDLDSPPGFTTARVRFIHAHPDYQRLLVDTVEGISQMQQLRFGDVSGTMDVPAGLNNFRVVDQVAMEDVETFERVNLVGGRRYELIILPDATDGVRLEIIERSDGS